MMLGDGLMQLPLVVGLTWVLRLIPPVFGLVAEGNSLPVLGGRSDLSWDVIRAIFGRAI